MVLGIHFFDDALKRAVLIEHKSLAQGPRNRLAVHLLLAVSTESL